jgi:hypothetical protein
LKKAFRRDGPIPVALTPNKPLKSGRNDVERASIHDFEPVDAATPVSCREPLVAKHGEAMHLEVHFEPCRLRPGFRVWRRNLLTDPQTSGGLLIACTPGRAANVAAMIAASGHPAAAIIGCVEDGEPTVAVQQRHP